MMMITILLRLLGRNMATMMTLFRNEAIIALWFMIGIIILNHPNNVMVMGWSFHHHHDSSFVTTNRNRIVSIKSLSSDTDRFDYHRMNTRRKNYNHLSLSFTIQLRMLQHHSSTMVETNHQPNDLQQPQQPEQQKPHLKDQLNQFLLHLMIYTSSITGISNEPIVMNDDNTTITTTKYVLSKDNILHRIEYDHDMDYQTALQSPLVLEDIHHPSRTNQPNIQYQWIYSNYNNDSINDDITNHGNNNNTNILSSPIAWLSYGAIPIFDNDTIQLIRLAVEQLWSDPIRNHPTHSRFTYQYTGNMEAHVSDLQMYNPDVIQKINAALQQTIYPTIRSLFLSNTTSLVTMTRNDCDENDDTTIEELDDHVQLFIYDALIIRYNATAAGTTYGSSSIPSMLTIGSGQPLHRDLGLFSLNVMLNDPTEFVGGGTYLENQYHHHTTPSSNSSSSSNGRKPLLPTGIGHGLIHLSSQRHAGTITTMGVRDILVFFITGIYHNNMTSSDHWKTPSWIQNAKLKQCRTYCNNHYLSNHVDDLNQQQEQQHQQQRFLSLLCRLQHLQLAIQAVPHDGEAYQYYGLALMEYIDLLIAMSTKLKQDDVGSMMITRIIEMAIQCYRYASELTPYDARVWNNWGNAMVRYQKLLLQDQRDQQQLSQPQPQPNDSNIPQPTNANTIGTDHVKKTIHRDVSNEQIEFIYQNAYNIISEQHHMGCDVENDYDSICLNYGLFLSNHDRFHEAYQILQRPAIKYGYYCQQQFQQQQQQFTEKKDNEVDKQSNMTNQQNTNTIPINVMNRILRDAYGLWRFCKSKQEV